jgi:hypothetical protein
VDIDQTPMRLFDVPFKRRICPVVAPEVATLRLAATSNFLKIKKRDDLVILFSLIILLRDPRHPSHWSVFHLLSPKGHSATRVTPQGIGIARH